VGDFEIFRKEMPFELHFEDPVEVSWKFKLKEALV
jgi:hypothetical protein